MPCTTSAPLTAHLQPQVQTIDVDKDAQFQCIVSGHPVNDVNWLHDGKPIMRDNRIEVSLIYNFHFFFGYDFFFVFGMQCAMESQCYNNGILWLYKKTGNINDNVRLYMYIYDNSHLYIK